VGLSATVTENVTDLHKVCWSFYWCESLGVVLDEYTVEKRPTKRHKHKVVERWSRLDSRNNRIPRPGVSIYMAERAVNAIRDKITYSSVG
jgi:hypothetical protein